MATIDRARGKAWLSDDELRLLPLLASDPDHDQLNSPDGERLRDVLREQGALVGTRLRYPLRGFAELIAAPKLRVVIETFIAESEVTHSVWANEGDAVLGISDAPGVVELSRVEPVLIPWAITYVVGLGPRPKPELGAPVTLPSSALDAAFEAAVGGGRERAAAVLAEQTDLVAPAQHVVADLLVDRRISWRASSIWTDGSGETQTRTVTVVDGGRRGLWLSETDTLRVQDPPVRLEPTRPSNVWRRIVALVPPVPRWPEREPEQAEAESG
ncbi:MAG: hypothetical protein ACRDPK_03925 [Carbonactinosporaceae bacterium]